MTPVQEKTNVIPFKISQLLHGIWAVDVLRKSVELNIFDQLTKKDQSAAEIATAIKADPRALTMFLDALVSIGLLTKQTNTYFLTEESRVYLVSTSPLFIGKYVQMNKEMQAKWDTLANVVRSGKPADQVNDEKRAAEFFPMLTETIFPINYILAQRVADELKIASLPSNAHILDVAAGAGTWSIPMALANKSLQVTALDFPAILKVTKDYTTKYGVADRYDHLAGNWREVSWKKGSYDVVILGHILHSEGKDLSEQLLQKCFEALKPGGALVIAEMIANDDRGGPPFPMLFGLNMLINTEKGCVFTEAELKEMLNQHGFAQAYRMPIPESPFSPIMIARKPA